MASRQPDFCLSKSLNQKFFSSPHHEVNLLNHNSEADVNLKVEKDLFFCDTYYYYYALLGCDFNHCFSASFVSPKGLNQCDHNMLKGVIPNHSS